MAQPLSKDLEALKERLLFMASIAEQAVTLAIKSVVERDDSLATKVKSQDKEIDDLEIEIDELAIQLLSKAPLATDLRLITVSMKICTDLERIGDEATTIARRALKLNEESQLKEFIDIPRMAKMALEMLDDALHAFVNRDTQKARRVIPRDKEVDALNKHLHRELSNLMLENPLAISRSLHLMVISKSIERIADHAKNVAEEAVFLWEAADIRHSRSQD